MKSAENIRKGIAAVLLVLAVALLVISAFVKHRVYTESSLAFEMNDFTLISEAKLTEDATFSGIIMEDGFLFSTYDRSEPQGKQACPT